MNLSKFDCLGHTNDCNPTTLNFKKLYVCLELQLISLKHALELQANLFRRMMTQPNL